MKNIVIVGLSLALFAGVFALRGRGGAEVQSGGGESDGVAPSSEATDELPRPRLIDLGSDRCIPCKQMVPVLEGLSHDFAGSFDVQFIDVWKDTAAGEAWGVRVIPTQIFLDADGTERFRHEGFFGREEILAKWRELGVPLTGASAQAPASAS